MSVSLARGLAEEVLELSKCWSWASVEVEFVLKRARVGECSRGRWVDAHVRTPRGPAHLSCRDVEAGCYISLLSMTAARYR